MYYTYLNDRHCLHCGTPIPDQARKSRIYCEREVLPDGSIRNCKDDYWSEIRSVITAEDNKLVAYHQQISQAIGSLMRLNLTEYEIDMLDNVGIRLDSFLQMESCEDGTVNFYFIDYCINVKTSDYKLKISKHDRELF